MINSTLLSLNIISLVSISPYFIVHNNYNGEVRSFIVNSYFSHITSPVFLAYFSHHQTSFEHTLFSYSLNAPIKLDSIPNCAIGSTTNQVVPMPLISKSITPDNFTNQINKGAFFKSDCGNISIYFCSFIKCHSKETGGSLFVKQNCFVAIHGTNFIDSYTEDKFGGACCIVQGFKTSNGADFNDYQLSKLNIQYCCFSGCYPFTNDESLYGLAIYSAASETILYYSSTVNCPSVDKYMSGGAQFDLQANQVKSKNINITGGYSKWCAGIEYRFVTEGCFKFQSITNIKGCMFATAFSNVNFLKLELTYSNYDNNTLVLKKEDKDTYLLPGLIHIRYKGNDVFNKEITISNFCFSNFINNDGSAKIVSRGTYYLSDTVTNREQQIKIILINCHVDNTITDYKIAVKTVNYQMMYEADIKYEQNMKTHTIDQLELGECHGNVVPDDNVIIEGLPEPTNYFTVSDYFSYSNYFSNTKSFSDSHPFSNSDKFSNSNGFSYTQYFSKSNFFSDSKSFSGSKEFSKSAVFKRTSPFTVSESFTGSNEFSKSAVFKRTKEFTESKDFSDSIEFSCSKDFSDSIHFTSSNKFSNKFH